MQNAAAHDATLLGRREVRPGVAFFDIELDTPLETGAHGRAFLPGQYVTVGALAETGALVRRPMTLTSTPSTPGRIELLLNRVRAPASAEPLSHLLFDLPAGARLFVRPAATGTFTLEDAVGPDPARALFIGTGTGLAPFVSMLRDRVERGVDLSGLALVEIPSTPEQALLPILGPEFPTLRTREIIGDPSAIFEDPDALGADLGLDLRPSQTPVFACGLGADLRTVTYGLLARGYLPRHRRLRKLLDVAPEAPGGLFLEQYDTERLFDLKSPAFAEFVQARFQMPQSG